MTLFDGENDLGDTIVLRLTETSQEIRVWEHISLHSSFLIPTDELTFTVAEDDTITAEIDLVPGSKIQLLVNKRIHFTGYIDKTKETYSRESGTMISCSCRDILGPVVGSSINPKIQFKETQTILDVLVSVLAPFGITTIYNDGAVNVNIMTGKAQKPDLKNQSVSVQLAKEDVKSDGTVETIFTTVPGSAKLSNKGFDPSGLKTKQLKPHHGEGAYQYIDRMLKRFGLRMWAAADGSGVIVGGADFTSAPTHTIIHSRSDNTSDVETAEVEINWEQMPSCIVVNGIGGLEPNGDRRAMVVIMVNEIVGTDGNGNIIPAIKDIIAQFPGAEVLPIRGVLEPFRKIFSSALINQPMFLKDDESRTIAELTSFARRKMATYQNKALHLKYQMTGFSLNQVPFAINTNINVKDQIFAITTPLWVLEREFERSRGNGSKTNLTLCLPFSLDLTGEG